MSNIMSIEVVEVKVVGAPKGNFGIIASDDYGSVSDTWYDSPDEVFVAYPTRLSVMEWLATRNEFEGAFSLKGNVVELDCVTFIEFNGFPDDDSVVIIEKE